MKRNDIYKKISPLAIIIGLIISHNVLPKLADTILIFTMLLGIYVISKISFQRSEETNRDKVIHHWQIAILAFAFLVPPPLIYDRFVEQNSIGMILLLLIIPSCVAIFIKDIPDFIDYLKSWQKIDKSISIKK